MVEAKDFYTLVLAIYGAAIATASAVWNVRSSLLDRAKLKIVLSIEEFSRDGAGQVVVGRSANFHVKTFWTPRPPVRLRIQVINVGRRPVTPKGYFIFERSPSVNMRVYNAVFSNKRILGEGESLECFHDEVRDFLGDTNGLAVEDMAGKEWRVSQKEFEWMKKQIQDFGLAK